MSTQDHLTDRYWKVAAWVGGHSILFGAGVVLVYWYMTGRHLSPTDLLHFDAEHYSAISSTGYVPFRQAFFPLMPIVWRMVGGGILSICVLNAVVYLMSLSWLAWKLRVDSTTLCFYLCIPSAIFFFCPYTEAMFFGFAVLVIIGLKEDKWWMVLAGLFLCSMTRPTFTTLLPSVLLSLFMLRRKRGSVIARTIQCLLVVGSGLFAVSFLQHTDTGSWFGFYTAQAGWGNTPGLPSFPLTSWGGDDIVRLDAGAMLLGLLVCGAFLVREIMGRARQSDIHPEAVLALSSLLFVTGLVLLLRDGALFSLNRFVFCTPYFLVVLDLSRLSLPTLKIKYYLYLFLALQVYFALFGSFTHIQNLLWFSALIMFILIVLSAVCTERTPRWTTPLGLATAFAIQVGFAVKFVLGGWLA